MHRLLALLLLALTGLFYWHGTRAEEPPAPATPPAAVAPEAPAAPADSSSNGKTGEARAVDELLDTVQRHLEDLLDLRGDIRLRDLGISFFIILLAYVLRNLLAHWLFGRLKALASRTSTQWDERVLIALEKPCAWFIFVLGVFIGIIQLPLSETLEFLALRLFKASTVVIVFWGLLRMTDVMTDMVAALVGRRDSSIAAFMPLVRKALRFFLLVVGVILTVDNLGYNVGTIMATLGLGGAALAFASKDTIANLYGSLALALDRPFKVGDWIQIGDRVDGDVEEIGLRSTKVRTWPKTVMSIPNSVLANEIINNWSRMPKRRVRQVVGLTYETTPEDMEGIVADIRSLLREDEGVQQDFILVNFTDFGASSLDILVYYFTTSTKWLEHMDVRQRVNLKIMRAVKQRGLSIAFPTRTLYLEGDAARRLSAMPLPGDRGPTLPP